MRTFFILFFQTNFSALPKKIDQHLDQKGNTEGIALKKRNHIIVQRNDSCLQTGKRWTSLANNETSRTVCDEFQAPSCQSLLIISHQPTHLPTG